MIWGVRMAFVILIQAMCAAATVLIAMLFGRNAALSAALGAAVVLVPNVLFALYLRLNGRASVMRLFIGEAVKIALILALSAYIWRRMGFEINVFAYATGLIVVIKAHNFGLLWRGK